MKIRIYNKGNGWYLPIGNYKNKEEKPIFMNIKFPKGFAPEPTYVPDLDGNCKKDLIVNEASFNKYTNDKGELKLSMSIFQYEIPQEMDDSKFGYTNPSIGQDELPFY